MCGRTALTLNKDTLRCACSYTPKKNSKFTKIEWVDEHNQDKRYQPSHNITPSEVTPVIVSACQFRNEPEDKRVLKPMMWDMVPPWHKGDPCKHGLSTNNCRLEGLVNSKLYKRALNDGGRCVIVADGFYEWKKIGNTKQPYFIYAPQQNDIEVDNPSTWKNEFKEESGWNGIKLLHMAGLYSVWENEDGPLYSYSVITMDSKGSLDWLHERMPAVLENDDQIQTWLDVKNIDSKKALATLHQAKKLSWHPVSTAVNNSKNKSNDCNKKIELVVKNQVQKNITSWFQKVEKRKSPDNTPAKKAKFEEA